MDLRFVEGQVPTRAYFFPIFAVGQGELRLRSIPGEGVGCDVFLRRGSDTRKFSREAIRELTTNHFGHVAHLVAVHFSFEEVVLESVGTSRCHGVQLLRELEVRLLVPGKLHKRRLKRLLSKTGIVT